MAHSSVLVSVPVEKMTNVKTMNEAIALKVEYQKREGIDDPFYVVDVDGIVEKYKKWRKLLPRVTPYYAVSCLSEPGIIELLSKLGLSFDCSSKNEIALVLGAGATADRIIYASPCKQPDMIRFAAAKGVDLMTFDNDDELRKIKRGYPAARLVLRILPPRTKSAGGDPGRKFGCALENARSLLRTAKQLELDVVGVSFHVGTGCTDPSAFVDSVQAAADAFEIAASEGFSLSLLDIGGGFPGQPDMGVTIEQIVDALAPALDARFPAEREVRIIAEPGSYFVGAALHLAVQVIGRRVTSLGDTSDGLQGSQIVEYYLNDGVYGSLCPSPGIIRRLIPRAVDDGDDDDEGDRGSAELFCSVLYGPTCDGLDVIAQGVPMRERQIGDWLVYSNMGHYSLSRACAFNGMPRPRMYYVQMTGSDS